jgi:hypothetical protein
LLGDGDKVIEIVYGEGKKIFCTGFTRSAKEKQKSLEPARQAQQPRKVLFFFFSFVILESPFTSVSRVSRGHPSLVCLSVYTNIGSTEDYREKIF